MSIVGGNQAGGDFLAIAQLLSDPERLKAEYDRLNSIKAQAEELLKLVGPAQDILTTREQAKADRAKAAAELARAHDEAREVMVAARKSAQDIEQAAERVAADTRERIGAVLDEAKTKRDECNARVSSLVTERDMLTRQKVLLEKAVKDAEVAMAAARAEEDALKAERARIAAVVAKLADELREHR